MFHCQLENCVTEFYEPVLREFQNQEVDRSAVTIGEDKFSSGFMTVSANIKGRRSFRGMCIDSGISGSHFVSRGATGFTRISFSFLCSFSPSATGGVCLMSVAFCEY